MLHAPKVFWMNAHPDFATIKRPFPKLVYHASNHVNLQTMRYTIEDPVKLNRDYRSSRNVVIPRGTEGVVQDIFSILQSYRVSFAGYSAEIIHDRDLD